MKQLARAILILGVCSSSVLAADQPPKPGPPPLEPTEADGHCLTPRQTWYTLLYWLQQGKRWEPERAAACLDTSGLEDTSEAPELAIKLKKVLDARGLWVPVEVMPTDPAFRNPDGLPSYNLFGDELGGIAVIRVENRWLFSAGTLARVPELYRKTVPQGLDSLAKRFPAPLKAYFIGVQVWQFIGIFILMLIAFITQKTVLWLLETHIRKLVQRIGTTWVAKTVRHIDRPVGTLAMAGILRVGIPVLGFPVGVARVAMVATSALLAMALVWLTYRLIDVLTDWLEAKAAATETKLDDQLVPLVSRSLKVFVGVTGIMFVLQNFNVDVGSLIAGLGLGGLAFALAAKDTVANFFGSLTIFIDKPFQIGDWIKIGTSEGTVEEVGFRTTRVRTFYNSLLTIPNSSIAANAVDNMGARRYRRYKTMLGLTYDTPPEKVQAFLEAIRATILALPGMRKDFFLIEFDGFGDFALQIFVYCFMEVPDWGAELRTRTYLNLEILRIARHLGVSFAFPTRTVHVEGTTAQSPLAAPRAPAVKEQEPSLEELARVIAAFGPGGTLSRPEGVHLPPPPTTAAGSQRSTVD